MTFKLHPQLKKDLILLHSFKLSDVFFLPNSSTPWLILVPRIPDIKELYQLEQDDQRELLSEMNIVSKIFETEFSPDKINIASFGNMVPQLHIHIICRYKSDPAWPGSIFGVELEKDQDQIRKDSTHLKNLLTR